MCDACITRAVKADVARRGLLKVASAAAVAMTALSISPAEAQARRRAFNRVVDLTHTLDEGFPTYFGTPAWSREAQFTYAKEKFNLWKLTYGEHIGTHFDAPLHFSADGKSVDEIPPEHLVCPLAVINVTDKAQKDADYRVSIDDIRAYERRFGRVPDGACVAMRAGWDKLVRSERFRGADAGKVLHFPGFAVEAAEFLIRERKVVGMAVDTLSLDHGPSKDFAVHYKWLPSGRYGIEAVANLDQVPPAGATLVAGAPKFKGGSGGPARLFALV